MNAVQVYCDPSQSAMPPNALVAVAPLEVLTCQLGGVAYGIELRCVQEIRSGEAPTRIANAPAFMKGIGTPDSGAEARILVLLDIEKLMSSAAMGLVQPVLQ